MVTKNGFGNTAKIAFVIFWANRMQARKIGIVISIVDLAKK